MQTTKDKQTFVLLNDNIRQNCLKAINACDNQYEVIIRKCDQDKTLKQLGAQFGVWVPFISQIEGESEDYVHKMLKAKFLARIYIADPLTPEQENWVELIYIHQANNNQDKLREVAKRISLSWCKLKQMKQFMNAIDNHYASMGKPLPEIDKYYKEDL